MVAPFCKAAQSPHLETRQKPWRLSKRRAWQSHIIGLSHWTAIAALGANEGAGNGRMRVHVFRWKADLLGGQRDRDGAVASELALSGLARRALPHLAHGTQWRGRKAPPPARRAPWTRPRRLPSSSRAGRTSHSSSSPLTPLARLGPPCLSCPAAPGSSSVHRRGHELPRHMLCLQPR